MSREESFKCFCCGVCCSKYQVQMTVNEAHNIADKLRIEWDEFEKDYLDGAWPGTRTVLLGHREGHCVFLEPQPDNRVFFCRIQKFKPESCIQWKADADKKDCQEGLEQLWDLGTDAEGQFTGDPGKVRELNAFLETLNPER
ncbi:MAG: YkgJ family cysteine cluster protein [Dehalogenimonas sp.]